MLAEANEIQWDVICLSETRVEDGNYTLDGGHRLFCGRNGFKYARVSILVHVRWAENILRFCKISDRVVYADLLINDRKYRIVAVYVPHGGYGQVHFDDCFGYIRQTILDGQRLGMKSMMGGDFNTEQYRGWRGDRLEELLCEMGLVICNDVSLLAFEDAWTFKSCLGTTRTLDYCMVSSGIITDSSKVIHDLVLRSDHRAVQSCLLLPSAERHHRKRRRKRHTDWGNIMKLR